MSAAGLAAGVEAASPARAVASRRVEPASPGFLESFPSTQTSSSSSSSPSGASPDPLIAAQATPAVRREIIERPRGRVAKNSLPTQTYNARAQFPALKVFQYARPLPEFRPFGRLEVEPGSDGARKLFAGSYGRSREPSSLFVDSLQ